MGNEVTEERGLPSLGCPHARTGSPQTTPAATLGATHRWAGSPGRDVAAGPRALLQAGTPSTGSAAWGAQAPRLGVRSGWRAGQQQARHTRTVNGVIGVRESVLLRLLFCSMPRQTFEHTAPLPEGSARVSANMRSTRVLLVLALAVLATASQPQCDNARAQCEADCAAQSLVATSFLCRDTPFGSLQSCTCGQQEASQGNTQEVRKKAGKDRGHDAPGRAAPRDTASPGWATSRVARGVHLGSAAPPGRAGVGSSTCVFALAPMGPFHAARSLARCVQPSPGRFSFGRGTSPGTRPADALVPPVASPPTPGATGDGRPDRRRGLPGPLQLVPRG